MITDSARIYPRNVAFVENSRLLTRRESHLGNKPTAFYGRAKVICACGQYVFKMLLKLYNQLQFLCPFFL
jgi:hypothetical protein